MKLSKRCEYALRCLIDLGVAHRLGTPVVPARELASFERISELFLVQILLQLKEAGIVSSQRGKSGGYSLAKSQDEVRLGDVIRLIDGPLAPIRCVSVTGYERCSCPDEDHCGLRIVMTDVRNAITGVLDQYTLAQIVEITLRGIRKDRVTLPFVQARSSP